MSTNGPCQYLTNREDAESLDGCVHPRVRARCISHETAYRMEGCSQLLLDRAEAALGVVRLLVARLRMATDILSQPMDTSIRDETRTYGSATIGVLIAMMKDTVAVATALGLPDKPSPELDLSGASSDECARGAQVREEGR